MSPSPAQSSERPVHTAELSWTNGSLVSGLSCIGLLYVACYLPVMDGMRRQYLSDDDMSHCLFAPIVAGYMLWENRERLLALPVSGHIAGIFLCILAAIQLLIGTMGIELFVARSAMLTTLVGVIVALWGFGALSVLAYPLLVLAFMIPIPGIVQKSITFPLQMLAGQLSEQLLDVVGYSVIRDGNVIELGQVKVAIVEACSGIRSLFSLLFLSVVYAYYLESSNRMRTAILAAAVPIAVLANASRIVVLALVSQYDSGLADGIFHALSGWTLTLVGFAAIVLLHRLATIALRIANRAGELFV